MARPFVVPFVPPREVCEPTTGVEPCATCSHYKIANFVAPNMLASIDRQRQSPYADTSDTLSVSGSERSSLTSNSERLSAGSAIHRYGDLDSAAGGGDYGHKRSGNEWSLFSIGGAGRSAAGGAHKGGARSRWLPKCQQILEELMRLDERRYFWEPIEERASPILSNNYLTVIRHPMCFRKAKAGLDSGETDHPDAFINQMRQIFMNCFVFSKPAPQMGAFDPLAVAKALSLRFEEWVDEQRVQDETLEVAPPVHMSARSYFQAQPQPQKAPRRLEALEVAQPQPAAQAQNAALLQAALLSPFDLSHAAPYDGVVLF